MIAPRTPASARLPARAAAGQPVLIWLAGTGGGIPGARERNGQGPGGGGSGNATATATAGAAAGAGRAGGGWPVPPDVNDPPFGDRQILERYFQGSGGTPGSG